MWKSSLSLWTVGHSHCSSFPWSLTLTGYGVSKAFLDPQLPLLLLFLPQVFSSRQISFSEEFPYRVPHRAWEENRDVLPGFLHRLYLRWDPQLWSHSHDRYTSRSCQVQYADLQVSSSVVFVFIWFFQLDPIFIFPTNKLALVVNI